MRAQMTITDLDEDRWQYLQRVVRTEYEIPADASRLCLTFSYGEEERHAEMPLSELIGLLIGISVASVGRRLQSVVGQLRVTDVARFLDRKGSVRQDCAFCHRERTSKDDNHADECPYWAVGPGSVQP